MQTFSMPCTPRACSSPRRWSPRTMTPRACTSSASLTATGPSATASPSTVWPSAGTSLLGAASTPFAWRTNHPTVSTLHLIDYSSRAYTTTRLVFTLITHHLGITRFCKRVSSIQSLGSSLERVTNSSLQQEHYNSALRLVFVFMLFTLRASKCAIKDWRLQ